MPSGMPPNILMQQQLPKGTVLDWTGNPIDIEARPSRDPVAKTGRVRDPWLLQLSLEVTPESLARLIRNDYPLPQQMALCNRMLDNDAHLASVYRDLVSATAGLDWEVIPFDDSTEAKAYADTCDEWTTSKSEDLEELLPLLIAGEFYPVAGAGMTWDLGKFLPASFVEIDPVRWYWENRTNSLKIRTLSEPYFGEDLPPNEFVMYRSSLRPGKGREGGLWRPAAWLYLFKHFTLCEWMEFAEIYGKPFRVAYYNRKEERDAIYQAMLDLGANAAGAFPIGTVIDLKEANRTSAVDVYKHLREACNDEMSELFVGHPLVSTAKPDSGQLAGGAAQKVHEKIIRAVARRAGRVIGKYVYKPIVSFHHGQEAISKIPQFKLKYETPEDEQKKAQTFVLINQALEAVEEAIDPEEIRETFNIAKTVPRIAPVTSPFNEEGGTNPSDGSGQRAPARRIAARAPRIKSPEDVQAVTKRLIARAAEDFSNRIAEIFEKAPSIEAGADAIWEAYGELDTARLASGVRDATVTAELMGRGDAGK
jgi:phage gp29-like protein